eukprot:162115-Chlamydomonas_euryale.AAC.2
MVRGWGAALGRWAGSRVEEKVGGRGDADMSGVKRCVWAGGQCRGRERVGGREGAAGAQAVLQLGLQTGRGEGEGPGVVRGRSLGPPGRQASVND